MRRMLQDCWSGPCKAVPHCYTLRYWQTRLWIWHTKINSRLSSTWVRFSHRRMCLCFWLYTCSSVLVWSLGLQSPLLVWFDLLMCHKHVFCCMNATGMSWVLESTVRYSHFSRWSTTDVQKGTPYLSILRFRMIFPSPWQNMCPVTYVLPWSRIFHSNAVIMANYLSDTE